MCSNLPLTRVLDIMFVCLCLCVDCSLYRGIANEIGNQMEYLDGDC